MRAVTSVVGAAVLPFFRGTVLANWYFRLLGARIGKRVFLDTADLADFDLIEVHDDAGAPTGSQRQRERFRRVLS